MGASRDGVAAAFGAQAGAPAPHAAAVESEQRVVSLLEQFSVDLADLQARVTPSLVQIRRSGRTVGAGVVWRSDGLILTNAHVVERRGRVAAALRVVLSDGRDLPAQVLAMEPANDLALLHVDAAGLTPVTPGDSQALRPGQTVVSCGFPYGVQLGATLGVVVAPAGGLPEAQNRSGEWVAASLHLRPGHSGGPMVDAHGRLVGINTLMNGPDVGVAVPVHVAQHFLQRAAAIAERRRAPLVESPGDLAWV